MEEPRRVLFTMSRFLDGGIDTILIEYLRWFAANEQYEVTLGIAICLDELEVYRSRLPANLKVEYYVKNQWLTYLYKKRVKKTVSPLAKAVDEVFLVPIRRRMLSKRLKQSAQEHDVLIDFDCCCYSLLKSVKIKKLAFFHFSFEHFAKQDRRRMKRIGKYLENYDHVVLIAKGMKKEADRMFPAQTNRFKVIYNPKDEDTVLRLAADTPSDEAIKQPFILAIERLTTPKDIPTLLKAFQILRDKYNHQEKLYIIGKGEEEKALRKMAEELGIADNVLFLGFQANPLPWLKASKMLVHSSRFEGLGMVLIEGLFLKKLMVATNCPIGPAEVLADGKAGLLAPVGNARELAVAMHRTLSDAALQKELLDYGQRQRKLFSMDTAGHQLEQLIKDEPCPRILFVISRFLDGGIDSVLIDYLQALSASGKYQITLAIEQDMDKLEVFYANIPKEIVVYHIVENNFLMKWRRRKITQTIPLSRKIYDESVLAPIRRFIIKRNLKRLAAKNDVVIDFDCCSYSLLAGTHTPKLAWFHFSFEEMMHTNKRRMMRISRYLCNYEKVVTISKAMYDEGRRLLPHLTSKLCLIYNAKDREELLARADEIVDNDLLNHPYILAVERLEESQKDLSTLLRAYQILRQKYHHTERLYLLGKGQSEQELKELAESLGIANDVVFLGFHENPYPWMKNARLLAHSAKMEGLPTVLLEGLMLNKLIVSTDCPTGPSEILNKGRAGLLVPVGDAQAMADAIHRLLTDEALQEKILAQLKQHRRHFMYEETERLFDELIFEVLKK